MYWYCMGKNVVGHSSNFYSMEPKSLTYSHSFVHWFNPIRSQLETVLDLSLVNVCMKECELSKGGHTFGLLAVSSVRVERVKQVSAPQTSASRARTGISWERSTSLAPLYLWEKSLTKLGENAHAGSRGGGGAEGDLTCNWQHKNSSTST